MVSDTATLSAWIMMLVMGTYLAFQCLTRRMELIGFPSLFILGMFQFYYVPIALFTFFDLGQLPFMPTGNGFEILAYLMPVFTVIYIVAQRRAETAEWPARWFPRFDFGCTSPGLLIAYATMAAIVGATFLLPGSGYQDQLLFQLRPTFAAAMVGFAAALIASNPWNPLWWALLAISLPPALVVASTFVIGRTSPLSVLLVVPWVLYYLRLRHRNLVSNVVILGIMGFAALVFLFAYSNIRHQFAGAQATFESRAEQLSTLLESDNSVFLGENIKAVFLQDAPIVTAFCIEKYPQDQDLVPFNGIAFFFTNPIPRQLWEGKPMAMGVQLQNQLAIAANLGIGIIGHGWVEGMYLGVVAYAVFFGLVVGWLDSIMRSRSTNPYLVVVLGSTCGQFLCVPRGETFQNLALMVSGWIACGFVLWIVSLIFGPFMRSTKTLDFGAPIREDAGDLSEYSEVDVKPALS